MARHQKFDLLNEVVQAVQSCGWKILFIESIDDHPFVLRIYNENEKHSIRLYIWRLTHGGGAKRPADEYRIQITGVDRFVRLQDEKTLILGWWEEHGIFVGFDFEKHQ